MHEHESKIDKDKSLSAKKYLNKIRPHLSDTINDHKTEGKLKVHSGNKVIDCKTQGEWKIQSTMSINFMFSKDSEGTRTMHTKSHNVQIMIDNETNDIIKELFKSLLHRYEDFPAQQKHWKKFKLNNKIIALNILFVPYNAKEIILAYKSKQFKA